MEKRFAVTLTFTTASGVTVTRKVSLRDTFARRAEQRAIAAAVPAGATNVTAKAARG